MLPKKVIPEFTLGFLVEPGQVLLALKTEKIGAGCWNGYGGKVESDESFDHCMWRELYEEADVLTEPKYLRKAALLRFKNTAADGQTTTCNIHVYLIHQWKGDPRPTRTMITPTWFDLDKLPLEQLMPADRTWLPLVLRGRKLEVEAWYGPYQEELLGPILIQHVDSF